MKLEFSRQIFEKCPNIKFHVNPSIPEKSSTRTDGRTDIRQIFRKMPEYQVSYKSVHLGEEFDADNGRT